MARLLQILFFEEGYRKTPYIDSEGYPTVGFGIRLGPKGAVLSNYSFTLPMIVGELWTETIVNELKKTMTAKPIINSAMMKCNLPRQNILYSMAYQMGVNGLSSFKDTLKMITEGNFTGAAQGMLNSVWYRQTPERAKRHAEVMRTGTYDCYEGLL